MAIAVCVTSNLILNGKYYELYFEKEGNCFKGLCRIDNKELIVTFSPQGASRNFSIIFSGKDGTSITFNKQFVQGISPDLGNLVPEGLEFKLKSLLFAVDEKSVDSVKISNTLFAANFSIKINLAGLPLVGELLPRDRPTCFKDFQLWISSHNIKELDLDNLRTAIPLDDVTLPREIAKGVNVTALIQLAGVEFDLSMDSGANTPTNTIPATRTGTQPALTQQQTAAPPPSSQAKQPGLAKWFPINKTLGPLTFKRIGGKFHNAEIHLMIDTRLALGPLEISLEGLSIGSSLNKFKPEFNLDGMGISYNKPPVMISGAFLRDARDDSFNGTAIIKTPNLTLAALGAYKKMDGQASIFIYAFLELVTGIGPAFFQINGISAGFGYNRTVKVPKVNRIKEFPLVAVVTGGQNLGSDPMTVLEQIKRYVPAAPGELFFAFGVKFNSFKLLHSFALLLLSVSGGNRFRLDILGLSRLTVPVAKPGTTQNTPLAKVELAIKASYDFDEGALQVIGVLTPESFILSRKCILSGGFAFSSWFKGPHAGDFVYTMGGYHPQFNVPAHYPKVPRLGFQWQLIPELSIKGEMYYALTPTALMAGGRLEALFQFQRTVGFDIGIFGASLTGRIKAWFIIGADFLISWQPYYYDAEVYLNIGIGVTFRGTAWFKLAFIKISKTIEVSFEISLSANLHIWGPEFAGIAHVDWKIVSFDIAFGAHKKKKPKPLLWPKFQQAFLPPDNNICSIAMEDGVTRKRDDGTWIVNPAELVISTHTLIPSTRAEISKDKIEMETWIDNAINEIDTNDVPNAREEACKGKLNENLTELNKVNTDFGISSMGITKVSESTHHITIRDVDAGTDATAKFLFTPIRKSAPDALWGKTPKTDIKTINDSKEMIEDMLMGFTITPKPKNKPDITEDKPIKDFSYDIDMKEDAFKWTDSLRLTYDEAADQARRATIQQIDTLTNKRSTILKAMGLSPSEVQFNHLPKNTEDAFLVAPQVVAA
jgi:Family of unknown function (DUF6603)